MIPRSHTRRDGPGRARLAVIDDVDLEAPLGLEERLLWFYTELIGLPPKPPGDANTAVPVLRFKSELHEMRITLTAEPVIESVDMRVNIEVPALEDTAALLEENRFELEWIHGIQKTDVACTLLDPAGNRILLRRMWGHF